MITFTFDNICDWLEIYDYHCIYAYKRKGRRVILYRHKSGTELEVRE